jgi:hypothetical protein
MQQGDEVIFKYLQERLALLKHQTIEVDRLHRALEDRNVLYGELQGTCEELAREKETTSQNSSIWEETRTLNDSLTSKNRQHVNHILGLEADKVALEDRIDGFQGEISEMKKVSRIIAYERENTELRRQLEATKTQLVSSKELQTRESQNEMRESQLETRESQIQTRESQIQTRESQLETRESQIQTRESQIQTRESQNETRESQNETRESQNETRESQLETRESQNEMRESQLEMRESQIQTRESQIKENQGLPQQENSKVLQLQEELDMLTRLLKSMKK